MGTAASIINPKHAEIKDSGHYLPHSHHVFCITFLQVDGINSNQMSAAIYPVILRLLGFNLAPQYPWRPFARPGYHRKQSWCPHSTPKIKELYPSFHNHGSVENGCISISVVSFPHRIHVWNIYLHLPKKKKSAKM